MKLTRKLSLFMFMLIFVAQSVLAGSGFPAAPGQNVQSAVYDTSVNDSVYGLDGIQQKNTTQSTIITENIITDFDLTYGDGTALPAPPDPLPNPIETELEMMVRYDFALPNGHEYKEGYTYTFDLPEQLVVYNEVTGNLGKGETIYGTFSVGLDGKVVFTFNENIEIDTDIEGWFDFYSYIDRELIGPTEQVIEVPIVGGAKKEIPVMFEIKGNSIDKRGTPDRKYNGSTITWEIDFNKDRLELDDVWLHDPISDPLEFIDGSIAIYELDVHVDGTAEEGQEVTGDFGDTFPIEFGDIDRQAYRVVFDTLIDEDGTSYSNTATLEYGEDETLDATATVGIVRGVALAKHSSDYDRESQTIEWEVKYNYNEKEIPHDQAYLTDTFGANQELVDGSVVLYVVDIDPDTGEETGQTPVPSSAYTVTDSSDGFTLQFDDEWINRAYKLIYETTAIERVYEDTTITNAIESGTEPSVSGEREIYQGIFVKSHLKDSTDYTNQTTNWRLTLNNDGYTMNNAELTDQLPQGMSLTGYSITHGGSSLTENVDYTYDYDPATRAIEFEFLTPITERVVIEYATVFNYNEMAEWQTSFTNGAHLTWEDPAEVKHNKSASDTFTPNEETQLNGTKSGLYNATTKEITWTIGINYNSVVLDNAVVTDEILGDQKLIFDSIAVYDMTINSNGDWVKVEPALTSFSPDEIGDNEGFTVNFGPIDSPYIIEYNTSLEDQLVLNKYENIAILSDGSTREFPLPAAVTVDNGEKYLDKEARQRTENEEILNWTVTINASQSTIANAKLTDWPSANQLILKDSFELYSTDVAADESFTKSDPLVEGTDYELEFKVNDDDEEYFELSFINTFSEISRPYILEYDTYLFAAHRETVENDAQLTGTSFEFELEDPTEHEVRYSTGDGGATGRYGKLSVSKVSIDEDISEGDTGYETPLAGAEFTLFDHTGTIPLFTETTDGDGHVELAPRLRFGEYVLRETSVPSGYLADPEATTGIPVTIDIDASETGTHNEVKVTNKKINRHVELTKIDGTDDTQLEGVVFNLYKVGETDPLHAGLVTNEQGVIRVDDLAPGDYYFEEVTAAEHYLANDDEIEFTIREDQTKTISLTVENELIPGSATIQKVDADTGLALEGATFEVLDADDQVVATVESDEFGHVKTGDLRPGDYTLQEKTPPFGFDFDDDFEPIEFTIARSEVAPAPVLDLEAIYDGPIENEVKTTSIEITKKDEINGHLLAGAEFELTYDNGAYSADYPDPITGITIADGTVMFEDLKPGTYLIKETTAPDGYIHDKTPFEVEVTLADVHHGTTVEVERKNDPFANVTLTKVDADTDFALADATFAVVDAADPTQPITGFTGLKTDDSGQLSITGLPVGTYRLLETDPPAGYTIQGNGLTAPFDVEARAVTEGTELIPLGNIDNDIITGKVELTKVDGDSDSANRVPLPEVEFKLNAISLVNDGTYDETTHETDEHGKIIVDDLRPGTYEFTEVEPFEGYQPHWGKIEFEIAFDPEAPEEPVELEVRNYKLVDVSVTKLWNDADDLDGFRPDEITVDLLQNGTKIDEHTITPDASGNWSYTFTGLDAVDRDEEKYDYTVAEQDVLNYERESLVGNMEDGFTIRNVLLTSLEVEKVWEDDTDATGDRPESVEVSLLQNGSVYTPDGTVNIKAENSWTHTFNGLRVYAPNGIPYNYSVEEADVTGYEQKPIDKLSDGFKITNVRAANQDIKITKQWVDAGDTSARPASITLGLFRKLHDELEYPTNSVIDQVVTPDADGNWEYTFTGYPVFDDDGKAYDYIVVEQPVAGYDSQVLPTGEGFRIVNTRDGETSVVGTKTWKDNNDATNDRPTEIQINLLRDGVVIDDTIADAATDWNYEFLSLAEFDPVTGARYEYTVKEDEVPTGYKSSVDDEHNITNTRTGEIDIPVTKTWKDDDDELGLRPANVSVHLLRNGSSYVSVTLNEANGWSNTFTGLDEFDSDGVAYTYTVEEDPVAGYKTIVDGYDITNIRTGETSLKVEKEWQDDNNATNARPEQITVELYRSDDADEAYATKVIRASDSWQHTFTQLPLFDDEGMMYEYEVKELPTSGYEASYDEDTSGEVKITNVRSDEISIDVTKRWNDGGETSLRPTELEIHLLRNGNPFVSVTVNASDDWQHTFSLLEAFDEEGVQYEYTVSEEVPLGYALESVTGDQDSGFIITNVLTTSIDVEKDWLDDGDTTDRPTEVTIELYKNGIYETEAVVEAANDWQHTFEQLVVYDEHGEPYTYTVKERDITTHYELSSISGNAAEGFVIQNVRVGTTEVNGTKTWEDDDVTDRPAEIKVNLLRNNTFQEEKTVTADDGWAYQFNSLQKYDELGKLYEYTVTEQGVPGYASTVSGHDITNTRSEKTSVTVTKGWKDDNNPDRPEQVKVYLLQNGLDFDEVVVKATEGWTHTFDDLDGYDPAGQAYTYTVEEEPVAGYETTINGYDITNVRTGKTEVTGTKTWLDDNNPDRPTEVRVNLWQNGAPHDFRIATEAGGWTYTFSNLDAFDSDGVAYEYTIVEEPVAGYQAIVDGYDLTNVRVGEISINGTKTWKDDGPADRPAEIEVILKQNGVEHTTAKATEASGWAYEFLGLDEYDEYGVLYEYTIEEKPVDGYDSIVVDFDVTNVRVGQTNVTVTKTWKDDNNPNRPEQITVYLLRNGHDFTEVDLKAEEGWTHTFTGLEAFDSEGKAYTFTVKEEPIAGYKSAVNDYDITNTRSAQTSIVMNKHWADDEGYADRPNSVTIELWQNANLFATYELEAANDWTREISGLEVYDDEGVAYTYSVTEKPVAGYVSSISGFDITNTLQLGSVQLVKVDQRYNHMLISDVEFELQDASGQTLQTGLVTDENGELVVTDLQPGDYQFVEISTPDLYKLDPTPIPFTIAVDPTSIVTLTVENEREHPPVPGRPADPDDPRDPRPEDPEDSEEPGDPKDPEDSEEPGDPRDPEDSEEPGDPRDPEDSEEPGDPRDPEDSEEPGDPTDPTDPADPSDPDSDDGSGTTPTPTDPADPSDPDSDDGSGTTPTPTDPADPSDPDSGDGSGTTPTPTDPVDPSDPDSGDGSGTSPIPTDPVDPSDPDSGDGSGTSPIPTDPVDPSEPGRLPNTATAIFNYGLIGASALLAGLALLMIRRKKKLK